MSSEVFFRNDEVKLFCSHFSLFNIFNDSTAYSLKYLMISSCRNNYFTSSFGITSLQRAFNHLESHTLLVEKEPFLHFQMNDGASLPSSSGVVIVSVVENRAREV